MLYIVDTDKDVETAARDLEETVKRNKFGVLHVHDLQKTLKEKGVNSPMPARSSRSATHSVPCKC